MAGKYFIATMGCQMNEYDSEYLEQLLMNSGYLPAKQPDSADILVINTCSVRAKAEQKAHSLLGRLIPLKKKKEGAILGIMGCVAQQEGAALLERHPQLDFVVGTREIERIPEILRGIQEGRSRVTATDIDIMPSFSMRRPDFFGHRVKSHLSVMEGCNNFCSYCVVPFVRGREVSRSPEAILGEAEELVSQGVKEITLLGQNVNSYSFVADEEEVDFPSLLHKLDNLQGLLRIRFTTSHPKDLSDRLIHCFDDVEKLCPHIHLPVQAGSNKVLAAMNRGYTRERYFQLVEKLRETRPDIAITSDVMVGFPGESDTDFNLTLDLVRRVEFDTIYSFRYSDRKGARASAMGGKVPKEVSEKRLHALQDLQKQITRRKHKSMEGQTLKVLVEGKSKRGGQLTGRTETGKIVNFSSNSNKLGYLCEVIIKESYMNSLLGEPL